MSKLISQVFGALSPAVIGLKVSLGCIVAVKTPTEVLQALPGQGIRGYFGRTPVAASNSSRISLAFAACAIHTASIPYASVSLNGNLEGIP